jgi:hypothetical protein
MTRNVFCILSVIVAMSIQKGWTQTCCSGGVPLTGNVGLPMTEGRALQFSLAYDYNALTDLMFENSELDDDSRFRSTKSILLQTGYAFNKNLSISALFSYVNQFRKITQFNTVNITETFGLGDAVILGNYRFHNLIGKNNELQLFVGPKLPIGETDKTNEDGRLIIADLQPGTGAWDFLYGGGYFQQIAFRPSASFYARFIHRLTGTNLSYLGNQDYKFGNEFQAFSGFSDQFAIGRTVIEVSLGINYRHANKDIINGNVLANTGGDFVYGLGSLGIHVFKNFTINAGIQIPVYNKPVGTQLVPSYRWNIGIMHTIPFSISNNLKLNIP